MLDADGEHTLSLIVYFGDILLIRGIYRVTPGDGYLEALQQDNVEVVTSGIKEINQQGLVTQDGKTYTVDIIIAATGYDTS